MMRRWVLCFSLLAMGLASKADPGDRARADALNGQIMAFYGQGRFAEATPLAAQLVAILERDLGPDSLELASGLNNLAELYSKQQRDRDALPLIARCLAIRSNKLGADHPDVIKTREKFDSLKRAVAAQTAPVPPAPPPLSQHREIARGPTPSQVEMERALALNQQSIALSKQERYIEALPLAQQVLAIFEKNLPPDHRNIPIGLGNLAQLYVQLQRFDEAEPLYQRALALLEKNKDANPTELGYTLANLANLQARQKHFPEAEALYRRCLPFLERGLGDKNETVDQIRNNLADIERAQGRVAEADPLLTGRVKPPRLALPGAAKPSPDLLPPPSLEDSAAAAALDQKIYDLTTAKRFAEALPLALQLQPLLEKMYGPDNLAVAVNLDSLISLYRALGRESDAAPLVSRAQKIRDRAGSTDHTLAH
jgi:tetratricopeptide (TPR) repeat protein